MVLLMGYYCSPPPEIVLGHGYAIPPYIHRMGSAGPAIQEIHQTGPVKVVKTVSQFDEPGGWKPVVEKYDEKDFEGGFKRDEETVTGPPFGDIEVGENDVKVEEATKVNSWKPYYKKTEERKKGGNMSYQKYDRMLQVEPELITEETISSKLNIRSFYNFIVKSILKFQHTDKKESV